MVSKLINLNLFHQYKFVNYYYEKFILNKKIFLTEEDYIKYLFSFYSQNREDIFLFLLIKYEYPKFRTFIFENSELSKLLFNLMIRERDNYLNEKIINNLFIDNELFNAFKNKKLFIDLRMSEFFLDLFEGSQIINNYNIVLNNPKKELFLNLNNKYKKKNFSNNIFNFKTNNIFFRMDYVEQNINLFENLYFKLLFKNFNSYKIVLSEMNLIQNSDNFKLFISNKFHTEKDFQKYFKKLNYEGK